MQVLLHRTRRLTYIHTAVTRYGGAWQRDRAGPRLVAHTAGVVCLRVRVDDQRLPRLDSADPRRRLPARRLRASVSARQLDGTIVRPGRRLRHGRRWGGLQLLRVRQRRRHHLRRRLALVLCVPLSERLDLAQVGIRSECPVGGRYVTSFISYYETKLANMHSSTQLQSMECFTNNCDVQNHLEIAQGCI